ncbi:MAG TPA: hypothetical protein DCR14_12730 [Acidimicrobiaceae bacterium]|nr:hypothetical protein [Acidimicrobiaceae bacterium]
MRNPCRVATAWLAALGIDAPDDQPAIAACDETERSVVRRQVATGVGCVPTTSVGRLFDVVASLLGVRHRVEFEAQAAIELEALAATTAAVSLRLPVDRGVFDTGQLVRDLLDAQQRGVAAAELAAAFHHAIARAVADAVESVAARIGRRRVALTGGVFQNALLHGLTVSLLTDAGHEVLTHRLVPANDGGLSLGQAVVAARTQWGGG